MLRRTCLVGAAALLLAAAPALLAQEVLTNAFTYQGQLKIDSLPVEGNYDFAFVLFDASAGGTQVGPVIYQTINVARGGLFTTRLDFGADRFNGDRRWLNIAVRQTGSGGSYVNLTPRQELSATPYALFAMAPWHMGAGGKLYCHESIGIGVTSPATPLHVMGMSTFDSNAAGGVPTALRFTEDGALRWSFLYRPWASDEFWLHNETLGAPALVTRRASNFVGIGESNPMARLHVQQNDLGVTSAMTFDNLIVEATDAQLGLFSARQGGWGSGLSLGEINSGALTDKWGLIRQPGPTSTLHLTYGTDANPANNATRMIFLPGGTVGIGTTSPLGLFEVRDVRPGVNNYSGLSIHPYKRFSEDFIHAVTLQVNSFGLVTQPRYVAIDDSLLVEKYVGIGGAMDPLVPLHVRTSDLQLTSAMLDNDGFVLEKDDAQIGLFSNETGDWGSGVHFAEVNSSTHALVNKWSVMRRSSPGDNSLRFVYGTNAQAGSNNTLLMMNSIGNLGLGTVTPSAKLHVAGNGGVARLEGTSTVYLDFYPDGAAAGRKASIGFGSSANDYFSVANLATNGHILLVPGSSGRVGIDRVPTTNMLEVEGSASKTTAGSWLANSDRRIKTDVQTIDNALDRLARVRLVSFKYTDEYRKQHPTIGDHRYFNVVAQEFAEVFPDFVKGSGDKLPNGQEILQVDSYPLTVYSVAAVQELHRMLKDKDAELTTHQRQIASQKDELTQLRARLQKLEAAVARLGGETGGGE